MARSRSVQPDRYPAAIDETGSAPLDDPITPLPDHPSTERAILALIREGALVVMSDGLAAATDAETDRLVALFFERIETTGLLRPAKPEAPGAVPADFGLETEDGKGILELEAGSVTARARTEGDRFYVLADNQIRGDPDTSSKALPSGTVRICSMTAVLSPR